MTVDNFYFKKVESKEQKSIMIRASQLVSRYTTRLNKKDSMLSVLSEIANDISIPESDKHILLESLNKDIYKFKDRIISINFPSKYFYSSDNKEKPVVEAIPVSRQIKDFIELMNCNLYTPNQKKDILQMSRIVILSHIFEEGGFDRFDDCILFTEVEKTRVLFNLDSASQNKWDAEKMLDPVDIEHIYNNIRDLRQ